MPDAPDEPEALPGTPAEPPLPDKIGRIAGQYLRASYGKDGDHSHYGLKDKNGQFYIGKDQIEIDGNDLVIKGKRYRETQGLCCVKILARVGFPGVQEVKLRFPYGSNLLLHHS